MVEKLRSFALTLKCRLSTCNKRISSIAMKTCNFYIKYEVLVENSWGCHFIEASVAYESTRLDFVFSLYVMSDHPWLCAASHLSRFRALVGFWYYITCSLLWLQGLSCSLTWTVLVCIQQITRRLLYIVCNQWLRSEQILLFF